ncbi:hypothetical protein BKA70DRAFT_1554183 [Coprinopsis sp. MPI-PUGE-AT-0042]|nr:hypothetical protein BKA70DRAFT_1554183 [Coprinopsis sp. MPI-PUGE-AT-0042]
MTDLLRYLSLLRFCSIMATRDGECPTLASPSLKTYKRSQEVVVNQIVRLFSPRMPLVNFLYEDTSPYFVYNGQWTFANGSYDQALQKFSESSYTTTNRANAYLELQFYGRKVTIVGSKRPQQGLYQVAMDGTVFPEESGFSPAENRMYNYTLFEGTFDQRAHVLTLTNKDDLYVQLDYIAWETSIGQEDEQLSVETLQDTHPSFKYDPADAWSTDVYRSGSYAGRTGHGTSKQGATVDILFSGDCIALYGPVSPNATSSFSVQVNGGSVRQFKANHQNYIPRQLLYWAGGLGAGSHRLRVINNSPVADEVLAVDYAEVYSVPSSGGSSGGVASGQEFQTGGPPKGLIAGLAAASGVAFLALIVLVALFFRTRRGKKEKQKEKAPQIELASPSARPVVPVISTQVPSTHVHVVHSPVLTKSTIPSVSGGHLSATASPASPLAPALERGGSHTTHFSTGAPASPLSYMSPIEESTPALPLQQHRSGDLEHQDAQSDAPPAYRHAG